MVRSFGERFPVVIVTGAGQTGKTSLLTHLYPEMAYISLDDPVKAANAESVTDKFLSGLSIPTLDDVIAKGGYPALYEGMHTASTWFPSYLMTYLERDVRNLLKIANIRDYGRFLRALAIRTAQALSLSDIARDIGVSPNAVRSRISVLQASGIVSLLEPYTANLTKRLVKTPKVYFNDSGLVIHLLGMKGWVDVVNSPLLGAVWETHVYNQIIKYFYNTGEISPSLWYWRTKDGHEVDFIIERDGRFILIESKAAENIDLHDLRGVRAFETEYGEKAVIKTIVACTTKKEYTRDGILFSNMKSVSGTTD